MTRLTLLACLAFSTVAFADASKDPVAGAPATVVHGDVKIQRPSTASDDKSRLPPVKDEPSATKTMPLVSLPASKLK